MNLILGSGIMRIFAVAAVAVSVSPAAGQIPSAAWEQMIAEKVDPGARRGLQDMLEKSLTEDAAVFVMELRSRK